MLNPADQHRHRMNTENQPDSILDEYLNPLGDPACGQLASLAAALYPHVAGKGPARTMAAASIAMEVWLAANKVLIERRQVYFRSSHFQGDQKDALGAEWALPGDPPEGELISTPGAYLGLVWRRSDGKPFKQNDKVYKKCLRNLLQKGYKDIHRDPNEPQDSEAESMWNELKAQAESEGIPWNGWTVARIRAFYTPSERPRREKTSTAEDAAQNQQAPAESRPKAKKNAGSKNS